MSWRKIPMKFPGTCIICNEKIEVNEIGLWAKGLGVKHEKCAQINEFIVSFVEIQLDVCNVNFKTCVIFRQSRNFAYVKNVVKRKTLLILIKNLQKRIFHF